MTPKEAEKLGLYSQRLMAVTGEMEMVLRNLITDVIDNERDAQLRHGIGIVNDIAGSLKEIAMPPANGEALKGVMVALFHKDGRLLGTGLCVDALPKQSQGLRAWDAATKAWLVSYAGKEIAATVDVYDRRKMWENMISVWGCTQRFEHINWPETDQ